MSTQLLIILLIVLGITLAWLYVFMIYTKIAQIRAVKIREMYSLKIMAELEPILECRDSSDEPTYSEYIRIIRKKIKKRGYRTVFEEILMEYLENPGHPYWQRVHSIAYDLELPTLCLPLIQSRVNTRIAIGCRKAGLYKYAKALPYMREALVIFSGETQFQILMGISRIGDIDTMQQAFGDISRYVMVNERAAFQILSVFSGDKYELYRRMINCGEDYIVALFLKSLDEETAKALSNHITGVLGGTGKETRVAAIKAISKTNDTKFTDHLIQALNDPDWEVRAMAAKSLGSVIDPAAGASLSKAVEDPEWWVRQNAASALLLYPNCEGIFLDIVKTKDAFARDSVINALESAGRMDMLAKIRNYTVVLP